MSDVQVESTTNGPSTAENVPVSAEGHQPSQPQAVPAAKPQPQKPTDEEEEEEEDEEAIKPNIRKGGGLRFIPHEGELKSGGPPQLQVTGSSKMEAHKSSTKKIRTTTEKVIDSSGQREHSHRDVQEMQKASGAADVIKADQSQGTGQQGAPQQQQQLTGQSEASSDVKVQQAVSNASQQAVQMNAAPQTPAVIPQVISHPERSINAQEVSSSHEQTIAQNQQTQMTQQPQIISQQPQMVQPQQQMTMQSQHQFHQYNQQQRHYQKQVTTTSTAQPISDSHSSENAQVQNAQIQGQQQYQQQSQSQLNQQQKAETQQVSVKNAPSQAGQHQPVPTQSTQQQQTQFTSHRQVVLQPAQQEQHQPQRDYPQGQFQRLQLHETPAAQMPQTQQQGSQQIGTQQQYFPQPWQQQQQQQQQQQYYAKQQHQYQKVTTSTQSRSETSGQQGYPIQPAPVRPAQPMRQVVLSPAQPAAPYQQPDAPAQLAPSALLPGMAPSALQSGMAPSALQSGMAPSALLPGMAPSALQSGMAPSALQSGMAPSALQSGTMSQQRYQENYNLTTKIAGDEAWIKEEKATTAYVRGTPWSGKSVAGARQKQWPPLEQEKVYVPYKSPVVETPQPRFPQPNYQAPPMQSAPPPFQQEPQQQQAYQPPPQQGPPQGYQSQTVNTNQQDTSYQYPAAGQRQDQYQATGQEWANSPQGTAVQHPQAQAQYQQVGTQQPQIDQYFNQQSQGLQQFQTVSPQGWTTTTYEQVPGGKTAIFQEQQFQDHGVDPASGRPYTRDVDAHRSYTSTGPVVTTSHGQQ